MSPMKTSKGGWDVEKTSNEGGTDTSMITWSAEEYPSDPFLCLFECLLAQPPKGNKDGLTPASLTSFLVLTFLYKPGVYFHQIVFVQRLYSN